MKKRLVKALFVAMLLVVSFTLTSCGTEKETKTSDEVKEETASKEDKVEETEETKTSSNNTSESTTKSAAKSTTKKTTTSDSSSKKTTSKTNNTTSKNNSTSNKTSSSATVSKNETSKNETTKNETTSTNKKEDKVETPSKKEETSSTSSINKKEEEKHTHDWKAVYKEVDKGYWKQELVKAAWTEEIPQYTMVWVTRCNGCGIVLSSNDEIDEHMKSEMLAGNFACGGYTTGQEKVQKGTKIVEHPAEYKDVWVSNMMKEVDYYKCSCGATKY